MKNRLAQPSVQTSSPQASMTDAVSCEKKKISNNNNSDSIQGQNKGIYRELANAVKSANAAAMSNRESRRAGSLDSPNGISSCSSNERGNNENSKTEMTLGARLKMQMYFEKPPEKQSKTGSRSTSQSSSRKAFTKDTKT